MLDTKVEINSIKDFCAKCVHFEEQSGVCKKIYANVRDYPRKFLKKCNGEYYEYDPTRKIEETDVEVELVQEEPNDDDALSPAPPASPTENQLPAMNESLNKWGIGLIILGAAHLVLTDFLDPFWGAIIIILGILNLIIKKRGMFIVNGTALLLVGVMNILDTILAEGDGSGWLIFGIFQLVWGVQEIRKFKLYADHEVTSSNGMDGHAQQLEAIDPNLDKSQYSGLGMASFILSIVAFFTQVAAYTVVAIKELSDPQWLEQESMGSTLIGLLMILSIVIVMVGIGLGVAGVLEKGKRKVFSVLGVVFNFLLIAFLGLAMIIPE